MAKVQQPLLLRKHKVNDLDKVKRFSPPFPYLDDSEVEEKKNDISVDNNTSKETTCDIPNELQAHSTSEKWLQEKVTRGEILMGRTCLHLACANGHPDVVSLLIERKCDLNLLDTDHRTPFMKAIQCEEEECATILLQHGVDPNIGNGSNNALHYVSYFLGIDLAAKLLHYKADIEAKNKEGLTPLFFAITGKNCEMAEFLLKNEANVNALYGSKRTILMVAVSMQSTEMVTLLLKYNVDHTIKDPTGKTAEEYAKIHDFPLYFYVKQTEKHMECNKACTPQISCSEKATVVPEFVSKASSLNEKEHMDNIVYTKVTPFYEDSETLSDIEVLTDASPEPSLRKSTLLDFLSKYGEELKQQLDAVSSRNRRMESMNRHLQEEAIENLKQKYDRLDLKHHLEILNHSQYGSKNK